MKIGTLLLDAAILLIPSLILGGSATNKKTISEEEFYKHWVGTWVNPELTASSTTPQLIISNADGTLDLYANAKGIQQLPSHTFSLIEAWEDSKGDIWFTATEKCPIMVTPLQEYGKISISNNTFERIYEYSMEPIEKWEPANTRYYHTIYYRLE